MHAASDLTCGKQAGNRLLAWLHHLRTAVDAYPAHGEVDARLDLNRVEGAGGDGARQIVTFEIGIVLGGLILVVGRHGLRQCRGIDADLLAQCGQRFAFGHQTQMEEAFHHLHALLDAFVKNEESGLLCLCQHGGRGLVARRHFIDEALAFAVHQNGTGSAHRFADQRLGADRLRRVNLDLVEIKEFAADFLHQVVRIARGSGLAGAGEFGEVRTQFGDFFRAAAVAARSQYHGTRHDVVTIPATIFHFNAGNGTFVHQELFDARMGAYRNAALLGIIKQQLRDIRAESRAADRLQGAVNLCAAATYQTGQLRAQTGQPAHGIGRFARHQFDQFLLVALTAAFHRVFIH